MHAILKDISVEGLFKPGEVYVLDEEKSREHDIGPIAYIHTITREEDILAALDLYYSTIIAEDTELMAYVGSGRISDDCYEFMMLCYDKRFAEVREMPMYLQRLRRFDEEVERWGEGCEVE